MHLLLPLHDEACGTVQNFNVFVSKTPVDAEVIIPGGSYNRPHIVAREKDDVVFLVG